MTKHCARLGLVVMLALVGCGDGGGSGGGGGGGGGGNVDSLTVADGETRQLDVERLEVAGDVVIDGTLTAEDDKLVLEIAGDLTVNGRIEAPIAGEPLDPDEASPLGDLPGIFLIVGGAVTIADDAEIDSDGIVVVTDDEAALTETLAESIAEANSADGTLPTLVPLPEDDPAFGRAVTTVAAPAPTRQGGPPLVIGGNWFGGPGPGIIFRFNLPDTDLVFRNAGVTVRPRPAPPADDKTGDSDEGRDATGRRGKNGANLLIWNNSGAIRVVGNLTINTAPGQPGGAATAVCATAVGGDGGKPGNFRMTARDGIDLSLGTLTLNAGAGGQGGEATVTGKPGAGGCPGAKGCDTVARGGKGGDNEKRLFVRGAVAGLENVSVSQVVGGAGGTATSTAGDGGPGDPCCDGGEGGKATATGGAGGKARVSVGTLPVTSAGATGGAGGVGTANGGNGGPGGDCKGGDGGDGGVGGEAEARGGKGGDGTATGGGGVGTGGAGGESNANSGDGGNGGDSTATPGAGGAAGGSLSLGGHGGAGTVPGVLGVSRAAPGRDGADGGPMAVRVLFCLDFGFVPDGTGTVDPGEYTGQLVDPETGEPNGTIPVTLAAESGGVLRRSEDPVKHLGIQGPGSISLDIDAINPDAPPIVGMQLVPLFGNGISESNPLVISYTGEQGQGNGGEPLVSILNNLGQLDDPAHHEVPFRLSPGNTGAGTVRIEVPPVSFVTFLRIYLIDP